MSAPETFVVCMKWGDRYPANYVNTLARAVADRLATPHRFVCVTDDAEGLAPGVEHRPFPPFSLPRALWSRGIWPKLSLFHAALFPAGSVVLYLDLDIVILGGLDPFVETVARKGGLWLIREWNPTLLRLLPLALRPDRGGNSSVVGWVAGAQTGVLDAFERDPDAARARWRNDQAFMTDNAVGGRRYWPQDWVASFKRHCVLYYPVSLLRPQPRRPDWARVVVFHGRPDPTDLIREGDYRWGGRRRGWGPVRWVQDYFKRYDNQYKPAHSATPAADQGERP